VCCMFACILMSVYIYKNIYIFTSSFRTLDIMLEFKSRLFYLLFFLPFYFFIPSVLNLKLKIVHICRIHASVACIHMNPTKDSILSPPCSPRSSNFFVWRESKTHKKYERFFFFTKQKTTPTSIKNIRIYLHTKLALY